jgi:translation elongation factor EF-Tu-like GTPase
MEGAILVVLLMMVHKFKRVSSYIGERGWYISYGVFINKLDSMVEADMKDLVEMEVRELLENMVILQIFL